MDFSHPIDVFANILGRPLVQREGPYLQTDGTHLYLPKDAQYVEGEWLLAHCVFGVTRAVLQSISDRAGFPNSVGIVGALEDVRVMSLWSRLYPGTWRQLKELWLDGESDLLPERIRAAAAGKGSGSIEKAVRMVWGRGPRSLVAAFQLLMGRFAPNTTTRCNLPFPTAPCLPKWIDTSPPAGEDLEQWLRTSEDEAEQQVEQVERALAERPQHSSWAETYQVDVSQLKSNPTPLHPDDIVIVETLRSQLRRLQQRKRFQLEDSGTSIDTTAYLQSRFTGSREYFNNLQSSPGYHVLLLVDTSDSLRPIFPQVARAARILSLALDTPQAALKTWAFWGNGKDLVIETLEAKGAAPLFENGGTTPLHWAISKARQYLLGLPGKHHLVVITDGIPYQGGRATEQTALVEATAAEVRKARALRIRTTGVVYPTEGTTQPKRIFAPDMVLASGDLLQTLTDTVFNTFLQTGAL